MVQELLRHRIDKRTNRETLFAKLFKIYILKLTSFGQHISMLNSMNSLEKSNIGIRRRIQRLSIILRDIQVGTYL